MTKYTHATPLDRHDVGKGLVVVMQDDDRYDPIAIVEAKPGADPHVLDFGTVGHGDIDVVDGPDGLRVAYVAQGFDKDEVRDFKRLFVGDVPSP